MKEFFPSLKEQVQPSWSICIIYHLLSFLSYIIILLDTIIIIF